MMEQSYMYTPETSGLPYASLPDILRKITLERPDQETVIFYSSNGDRSSITFSELNNKCELFAKGLMSLGFVKGNIIAMSCKNSPEWLVCSFGMQIAGLTPLYLSSRNTIPTSIVDTLKSIGNCVAFIHDWENVEVLSNLLQENIPTFKMMLNINSVNDICEDGQSKHIGLPKLSADDICGIFLTSGSTGIPKAIRHTHRMLYGTVASADNQLEFKPGEKVYSDFPFNWVGSYPITFLVYKTILVTATNVLEMRSVEELNTFVLTVLKREKCGSAFFISPCIHDLLSKKRQYPNIFPLRLIFTGGMPIDRKCAQVIGPFAKAFVTGYGCSEVGTISIMAVTEPGDYDNYETGKPVAGVEIKIVDEDGGIVPVGSTGEIYVRGRERFQGYMNVTENNVLRCNNTGWYKTDDLGFINTKGRLVVSGRKSDVMIIGGALVSPSYMEAVLKTHNSVENACVFPIHNEEIFEEACAAIVLKRGFTATEADLIQLFKERKGDSPESFLENRNVPRKFLFLDCFPKTDSGKIDRKALKLVVHKRLNKI